MRKDSHKALLEERVQIEKDAFERDISKVRSLLKSKNALDLEDMILSGLENFNVVTSLPGSLNGRS